jgi:phage-related protein (TIGR01555 family)
MANPVPINKSSAPGVLRVGWFDTLSNWLTGMMLSNKDKTTGARYYLEQITPDQLEEAFRSDWIARKIISIPAWDSTREWRDWQAEQDQIETIEDVEREFNLQAKVREALVKARLYGGAGIIIGTQSGDTAQLLEPESIGEGGLLFLHVVTRHELSAGPLENDITSPYFGVPQWYTVNSLRSANKLMAAQRIHPSRVVRFVGNPAPSLVTAPEGWGDPVLWVVNDAVRSAGLTSQSIAQLIQEAKVDFIKVPELSNIFATQEATNKYVDRMSLINTMKSSTNAVLLDKDEEWDRTQITFGGMPDVLQTYLIVAAGAADIPATRLLGRSPAGMDATGDSDMRNYYDRIKSEQSLTIEPALQILDQCLQVHAFGALDEDIFYEWSSLWQMDEEQKAKIDKSKAEAAKIIVDTGLVPFEALAKGFQNMLIEEGTYPGIEAALQEAEAAGDLVGEPLPLMLAKAKPKPPQLPAPKAEAGAPVGEEEPAEEVAKKDDSFGKRLQQFKSMDERLAHIEDVLTQLAAKKRAKKKPTLKP